MFNVDIRTMLGRFSILRLKASVSPNSKKLSAMAALLIEDPFIKVIRSAKSMGKLTPLIGSMKGISSATVIPSA